MNAATPPLFVITGGPGSGKTTLIEALARQGFPVSGEAGRKVIREQQAINGRALPWIDPLSFAEAMLAHDIDAYRTLCDAPSPVFFDRGIPDTVGYLRLEGVAVLPPMIEAARTTRYNARVFICPPWPEIYATDSERKQTAEIAERTYQAMAAVYPEFGYKLVEVPRVSVEERVQFVRETISSAARPRESGDPAQNG
jgi:predicted ATPase